MVTQLMRAEDEPGISKLGYWNPKTQQLQLFTKDIYKITGKICNLYLETELMELYTGHEGMMPYEVELDVG